MKVRIFWNFDFIKNYLGFLGSIPDPVGGGSTSPYEVSLSEPKYPILRLDQIESVCPPCTCLLLCFNIAIRVEILVITMSMDVLYVSQNDLDKFKMCNRIKKGFSKNMQHSTSFEVSHLIENTFQFDTKFCIGIVILESLIGKKILKMLKKRLKSGKKVWSRLQGE